jgi:uncharacterized membrane-anchored protein
VNRRTWIAAAVHVVIMVGVLLPPLWVRWTGTTVYLETEKMDPRSLFRGDFVILGYRIAQGILVPGTETVAKQSGLPVYVTVTTERPGRFVAVDLERPSLQEGQACLVGRARGDGSRSVDFPQIAQYFVPEGEGRELEARRGDDLLARAAVSGGCNAVLLGLETR